jgi:hypothetical protein
VHGAAEGETAPQRVELGGNPVFRAVRTWLVRRRPLQVIDHYQIDRPSPRLQLQAELLLQRGKD